MKRTTLIATVATGALLMTGIFAGSAGATAFCKTANSNYVCPAGKSYAEGTELKASLVGTATFATKEGEALNSCTESTLTTPIPKPAEAGYSTEKVNTGFTFGSCTSAITTNKPGSSNWWWREGTHNANFRQIFGRFAMTLFGTTCEYQIYGSGEFQAGVNSSRIVFLNTAVTKTSGTILCPSELKLTGEYLIGTPNPLYVENGWL